VKRLVCIICILLWAMEAFAAPWTFLVVPDTQGVSRQEPISIYTSEIATEIVRQDPDLVIHVGDLVYGGTESQEVLEAQFDAWLAAMGPVYDASIPVYPIRGNHDWAYGEPTLAAWQAKFDLPTNGPDAEQEVTYSFTYNNALFIALDQAGADEGYSQHMVNQAWLDTQLAANTRPHVFVYGHEAAFNCSAGLAMEDEPTARNTFWESLDYAGVKMYFCGHNHLYNRAEIRQTGRESRIVYQVIAGSVCTPLYTWSRVYYGVNGDHEPTNRSYQSDISYVLMTVDHRKVTLEKYVRTDVDTWTNKDQDRFSYMVHAPFVSLR